MDDIAHGRPLTDEQPMNEMAHSLSLDDAEPMDDIEDLILTHDEEPVTRLERNEIQIKPRRKPQQALVEITSDCDSTNVCASDNCCKDDNNTNGNEMGHMAGLLPGKGRVYIKTWGCSHNNSDGEYMAGLLAEHGYTLVEGKENADVVVLNSCTVKNPSEAVFINEINRAKEKGAKIVVAGCVPQGQPNSKEWEGLSMIGVQQIDRVVEVVEQTLQGNVMKVMGQKKNCRCPAGFTQDPQEQID